MNFKKISIEIKNEFIDIIYDSYSKKFYTYEDKKHWSYIEGDHIKSHIFKTRDEVTTPNQTNTVLESMKYLFMLERGKSMNNNRNKITLLNGVLDIEEFKIEPHKKDYHSTNLINIELNDDDIQKARDGSIKQLLGDAPMLKKYFYGTFHKSYYKYPEATIETIQQIAGLCLAPHCKAQKAFFLLGDGENGKSVFIDILEAMLNPESVSSIPFSKFSEKFEVVDVCDKLANISAESGGVRFSQDASTDVAKAVITGDRVRSAVKFLSAKEFRPMATLIFSMNHLPEINDDSHGFIRRIVMMEFKRKIPENEKVTDLSKRIIENEMKQFFVFALGGLIKMHESNYKNFRMCDETIEQTEAYKTMINPFNDFMKTKIVINENAKMSCKAFQSLYREYIEDTDNPNDKLKNNSLGIKLKKHMKEYKFFRKVKNHQGNESFYSGIGANPIITTS